MKIHVVEDDWGVRDALIELVQGLGHPVAAYADGEAFMKAEPPKPTDLIFVDLGLPGLGGVDVIKWLKGLKGPPRIVAISGRPRKEIDTALREHPDLALLRKPLSPDAIASFL